MGRSIIAFPFLLIPLSSICSPDSTYVCTAQYHKIFILFVQRLSSVLFLFVSTERPRALFAAEAHTYRKQKPIHARKFGYDVGARPVSVHTDSERRDKKLSRVQKKVSDICVAVPFDEQLTILRLTNGVARVKIWIEVSCVRLTTKFSEINFLGFTFCLVTLLVTLQGKARLARRNKKYN